MAVANKLVNKPVQKVETTKYMANGMQVTLTPGTVKNYLISGDKDRVSDQEVAMFINLCRFTGLNPWLREAYCIKYGNEPATMTVGVAAKADAIVPNPVQLRPYRTFQEVEQPVSQFVFRIGDRGTPEFKLVEAEGGIWKTEAVRKIKDYLELVLSEQDMALRNRITIIG